MPQDSFELSVSMFQSPASSQKKQKEKESSLTLASGILRFVSSTQTVVIKP